MSTKFVTVESPYRGGCPVAQDYLDHVLRGCFERGYVPLASHAHYTRCLQDAEPDERRAGIEAGFKLGEALFENDNVSHEVHFYLGLGISRGVADAMRFWATYYDRPIWFYMPEEAGAEGLKTARASVIELDVEPRVIAEGSGEACYNATFFHGNLVEARVFIGETRVFIVEPRAGRRLCRLWTFEIF